MTAKTQTFKPETDAQVLEILQWAVSEKSTLDIVGQGTKRKLGAPVESDVVLDLSALSGIDLYEPQELVMTAKAGTPLLDVEAALDDAHQMLAFEPWKTDHIYGVAGGTIGGVFAANLSGPRRPLAGAARDHLLGFHAVSGRGEVFKSGGRVVKNVTGFDLSKLMAGSMGTLAVMTDVSFKVLPRPEKSRTILVRGAKDPGQVMRDAQNSPYEVSGVAHLPQDIVGRSSVSYVSGANDAITAVRVEGPAPSVASRYDALRALLSPHGEIEELHSHNTRNLWREIRDVQLLPTDHALWRISVAPTEGPKLVATLADALGGAYYFDWAGGLIWLTQERVDAQKVRSALNGGHATLIRAPEDVRKTVAVFPPQDAGVAELCQRVRAGFDPHGLLNPGRMG